MKGMVFLMIGIVIASMGCSFNKRQTNDMSVSSAPFPMVRGIIGIVTLRSGFNERDTIKIFNEDGSLWYEFSFTYDDSDGKYDFYNETFKPLLFNPDSYSLALTAVSSKGDKVEVIVNEVTRLRKYLYTSSKTNLTLTNCSDFLTKAFAVSFDPKLNPVRKSIGGQRLDLKKSDNFLVTPLEISGDWLKVRYEDFDDLEKVEGWIKWSDGDRILVQIHPD